jgi:hypothetical protein
MLCKQQEDRVYVSCLTVKLKMDYPAFKGESLLSYIVLNKFNAIIVMFVVLHPLPGLSLVLLLPPRLALPR